MSKEAPIDTKQKILEAANELFAENSFGSTSMREIATKAGVNLAAINYHFINKENLYYKVFDYNYDLIFQSIKKFDQEEIDTAELAVKVFNYFMTNSSTVMNTFKIFLLGNVELPPEIQDEAQSENVERFGPPGQDIFLKKISADLADYKVSEDSKYWAMRMIFSLIIHHSVMMNTPILKLKCEKNDEFSPEKVSKEIFHSVHAHLDYIKTQTRKF